MFKGLLAQSASVISLAVITILLGFLSIAKLPIELTPDIVKPTLVIQTQWPAASPQIIEEVLIEQQERVLQNISGINRIESTAYNGLASIMLTFNSNSDLASLTQMVSTKLGQIENIPLEVSTPQLLSLDGSNEALSWLFLLKNEDKQGDGFNIKHYAENILVPKLEKLSGVSNVAIYGDAFNQLVVDLDLYKLTNNNLSITQVKRALQTNFDISAGTKSISNRDYRIIFESQYDAEDMREMVVDWKGSYPVKLGDVAEVSIQKGKVSSAVFLNGKPGVSLKVMKMPNSNSVETLTQIKEIITEFNAVNLDENGLKLSMSFDPTKYIYDAIDMVSANLLFAIISTVLVVYLFIRNSITTALVAICIPISLLSTLSFLYLLNVSLNLISLAGLAISVGLVVDAVIVVLESIRQQDQSKRVVERVIAGADKVKGALFSSTITTLVVFGPIITMSEVEGQIFRDLAVAISIAVLTSLVISLTLIPVLYNYLSPLIQESKKEHSGILLKKYQTYFTQFLSNKKVPALVLVVSFLGALLIFVKSDIEADYLPAVEEDMMKLSYVFDKGTSLEHKKSLVVEPTLQILESLRLQDDPVVKNYFVMFFENFSVLGIRPVPGVSMQSLEQIIKEQVVIKAQGVSSFVYRNKFLSGQGWSKKVDLNLQAADMQVHQEAADELLTLLKMHFPESKINPKNSVKLSSPILKIEANRQRMAQLGWDTQSISLLIQGIGEGSFTGDYFDGNKRIPTYLKINDWDQPSQIANYPVISPTGQRSVLGDLFTISESVGPSEIYRLDGVRASTFEIYPGQNLSVNEVVDTINSDIAQQLALNFGEQANLTYGGVTDKYQQVKERINSVVALAFAIVAIVLLSLLKNVTKLVCVLTTVLFASSGGLLFLEIINIVTIQKLDMLTMVGFIIGFGLVVNNSILAVQSGDQTASQLLDIEQLMNNLKNRLKPIIVTTITSIVGMVPLIFSPGDGSMIYRGLATVIVGSLVFGMIYTLFILPALYVYLVKLTNTVNGLVTVKFMKLRSE
ncbi:efflux RND transporter permease subunit [Pseudoalteromonas sp. MTN2-4]|uniref:efflux RND transporter permease subunit n=1 Tax=Pseudoalteromonas sp. MTN2-4 TaxID=3056555 RepID=UPI0036F20BE4